MQRAVTLEDVAAATGCSTATVSLALRNKPGVSRSTRERVLAAAQSLGYQRVSRPSTGTEARTLDIAVVFRTWIGDEQHRSPVVTGFYSWVLTGLQESAVDQGAHLLLATIPVDAANEATDFPERLLMKPLDGIVLAGSFKPEIISRVIALSAQHRPMVVLVDASDPDHRLDSVETANFEGGVEATRYLIGKGHRRIGWFGAMSEWEPNFRARRDGYEHALRQAGLTTAGEFEPTADATSATDAARQVLEAGDSLTAFVCSNDSFALALMRAAKQSGRRIPEDLSVIGFDDIDQARDAEPPLTTMAIDKLGLGRHAMYAIANRLTWPESPSMRIVLQPTLVERETVRTI
jgi:DNA-binding LacI/PurR family transcriptional regulator